MGKTNVANVWLQTRDRKVIKGNQVLNIGDIVHYHDKAGKNGAEKYTGTWRVLGARNGELLIMSAEDVSNKHFNVKRTIKEGKKAYINGINELNKICKVYGTGIGATGSRSITVEDVNRVTGYNKKTYKQLIGVDKKIKYGESITYYWDTMSKKRKYPYYTSRRGQTGNLTNIHSKFVYHNGTIWQESKLHATLPKGRQKICTLTQTGYEYDVDKETTLKSTEEAYKMLFGCDNARYWLASTYVDACSFCACFGLRIVIDGGVRSGGFVFSDGDYSRRAFDVRAVVTLKSNIKFEGTAASGYEIK